MSSPIYDVVVVGLGAHGSAAIHALSARGLRCCGIEAQERDYVEHGSSHGRSRVIRQAYFEDPAYVPLVRRSFELWRDLEKESGEVLLSMTGALMIGKEDSVIVKGTLESCAVHDLSHRILTSSEARQMYSGIFQLQDDEIAVWEEDAGYLDPEKCISTYQRLAENTGNVTLRFGTKFESFEEVKEDCDGGDEGIIRIKLKNDDDLLRTKKLILCLGAWVPEFLQSQQEVEVDQIPSLRIRRKVLYWFEPDDMSKFEGTPVYIWDSCDAGFYGFPPQPGSPGGVKVSVHIENNPIYCPSAEAIDREVTSEEVQSMRDLLQFRLPSLAQGKVLSTKTCMYTCTLDEHFVIDFLPTKTASNNIIICSACSGHGFKMGSVIGEILSDLSTKGFTEHNISLFKCSKDRA